MAGLEGELSRLLTHPLRIVAAGDELLRGDQLDSNSHWLASHLHARGFTPDSIQQVPDRGTELGELLRRWRKEGGSLVIGGGLGPTADDRTRDDIASGLGLPLVESEIASGWMMSRSKRAGWRYSPLTMRQALLPEGFLPLRNEMGTAPAFYLPWRGADGEQPLPDDGTSTGGFILVLPGVPREYRSICRRVFAHLPEVNSSRTWLLAGVGEDALAAELADLPGLERLGFYPGLKGHRLRVPLDLDRDELADRLTPWLVSRSGETLEGVILALLRQRRETLSLAESCTAGMVSARLGEVPGASAALVGGLITYSDRMKEQLLGVPAALIVSHGAVSREVALAMARGARERTGSDWAVSVTGIAGPAGERPEKPVGTTHIGLAGPADLTDHKHLVGSWDRAGNRAYATLWALTLLWLNLRRQG